MFFCGGVVLFQRVCFDSGGLFCFRGFVLFQGGGGYDLIQGGI
jgi:hypothetical protein